MKQKTLILLSLVTAIVVVATVLTMKEDSESASTAKMPMLGELADRVNDVARIELTSGGTTLTIAKQADDWTLESSGGYPAKFEVIKSLLLGLKELEKAEGKTSNPDLYDRLGVEPPSDEPGGSTQVELMDDSGARICAVILGDRKEGRAQQLYARKPDEAQAWLVNGRANLQMTPGFWMEKQFANITQDRIASVSIERADEAPLRIFKDRPSDPNFKIANLPDGREPISESIANSIASGLNFLSLEEVRPATEVEFTEPLVATATYRTWDGMVVRVETTRVDEQNWIRLSARSDALPEILPEPAAEGEEPVVPAPFEGASAEELATEIQAFNDSVGPWAYRVAPYKLSSFEKRLDELLRELPAEAAPQAAPEAPVNFDPYSLEDEPAGDAQSFGDIMSGQDDSKDEPETDGDG